MTVRRLKTYTGAQGYVYQYYFVGKRPALADDPEAPATEFVPFGYLDSTNKTVLTVHIGRRHATVYSFTVGVLSILPEQDRR